MAFTFDSTVSGTTANSYISVSDADDYFAGRLKTTNWPTITGDKQKALVMATRRINRELFSGLPTVKAQVLAWPRQLLVGPDGFALPSATIPKEVLWATCEMALYFLDEDDRLMSDNELENFNSYEVGPLKLGARNWERGQLPSEVSALLLAIGPNAWIGKAANQISTIRR